MASLLAIGAASAAETIVGPIQGEVRRVIDGDTFEFVAHLWLGLDLTTHVRVRGIDAPESRGACQQEKELAARATRRISELTAAGVTIANVGDDKYSGRVVADVTTLRGTDVKRAMIESGLARAYESGPRQSWCEATAGR